MTSSPNSVNPERDEACYQLALYLQSTINTRYGEIRAGLTNPFPQDPIATIREWNCWNIPAADFPALCCFRTRAMGRHVNAVDAKVVYYLKSMTTVDEFPGLLGWVGNQIALNLAVLRTQPTFASDNPLLSSRVRMGEPNDFEVIYPTGVSNTTQQPMGWLEFKFSFIELGV